MSVSFIFECSFMPSNVSAVIFVHSFYWIVFTFVGFEFKNDYRNFWLFTMSWCCHVKFCISSSINTTRVIWKGIQTFVWQNLSMLFGLHLGITSQLPVCPFINPKLKWLLKNMMHVFLKHMSCEINDKKCSNLVKENRLKSFFRVNLCQLWY